MPRRSKTKGKRCRKVGVGMGVMAPVGTPVYGPCRGRGVGFRNDGQDRDRYILAGIMGVALLFYGANKALRY